MIRGIINIINIFHAKWPNFPFSFGKEDLRKKKGEKPLLY